MLRLCELTDVSEAGMMPVEKLSQVGQTAAPRPERGGGVPVVLMRSLLGKEPGRSPKAGVTLCSTRRE